MSALAADTGAGQTSRPVSKDPKQELELLQRRLLEQQRILDMHRQRGNAARGGSAQVPTGAMQGMLPGGPGAAGSFSSCSPSSSPSPPVNTTQSDSPSTAAASLEPKRPVVSSMTVNPSAGHNHISSSDATPSPIPHQNSAQASPISAGTHELSVPTQAASRYSQQPDRQSRSITGPSSPVSPAAATAKKLTGFEQLASLTQGHHELTCNFTAFRTAFDGKFAMLEAMLQQVLKNQQVIHQQGSCILRLQQEVRVLQAQQQNSQQKCQGEYYPNGQGEEDVHQQGAHLPIATSQATASIAHSAKSGRNALSELLDVSQRNQFRILDDIKMIPEDNAYRMVVEAIYREFLRIVSNVGDTDWRIVERKIGLGQVEQLVYYAMDERELVQAYCEWKLWLIPIETVREIHEEMKADNYFNLVGPPEPYLSDEEINDMKKIDQQRMAEEQKHIQQDLQKLAGKTSRMMLDDQQARVEKRAEYKAAVDEYIRETRLNNAFKISGDGTVQSMVPETLTVNRTRPAGFANTQVS
eukprot:gene8239-12717_t